MSSWNEVKNSSQQKSNKQKQNVIIDNEDIEDLGKDSIFNALADFDSKEQKKNNEKASKKEMKQSSSNESLPSPKTPKKNTDTPVKTAPIEELSKLNVSNYISHNIKINDNEQDQIDQLKKLCNFIETEITNKLFCCTTKFSNKSFDIDGPNFKGPISYLAPKQRKEIENVFLKCKESVIKKLFVLITKCIFVGEKKAVNSQTISNTIAHQLCVQIISKLYPGIFYKPGKEGKKVYEQTISHHKNIIEKLPAIGNTLIWVCNQQRYNVNKKEVYCPEYVGLWMECFLDALTSNDASIAIQTQSVKLLNKVLDGIKENKDKLSTNVRIPVESFIALIAILNTENVVSQIKKHDKLYSGVTKAYDSIKYLLFDSSKVLQFNVSNMEMFVKLYKLLSDPKYDRAVYNEFLNVIVLAFAKDPSLFDAWGTMYKQHQQVNLPPSNAIVEEIKRQQTEYFKNKKHCPYSNCWEELDNNNLRNTFYEVIGVNEQYRNKNNENETNKMNKNIRAILNKTTKDRSGGGFFSGFLMKLIRRSALLVLLISLSLHIFDSVDSYNTTKDANGNYKLPNGHPVVAGNDFSKCPYHNFRNKYTKCNQCHPIVKYVYDSMEEPYKYIEKNIVMPAYENVWKKYCTKPLMISLDKGVIPAYRYVKPIVKEKVIQPIHKNVYPVVQERVIQPVHDNVIPRAVEMYDTYAKEYVDRANENVFKPAYSTGSKYLKQAYVVSKPYSIKTKNYIVNDIIKPSLPYINKAKVRGIQYGNQFLDTLAEIPYRKLMKNGASNTLRFVGHTENNMEKLYTASTPYAQKYWDVLSRKTDALMKQENVQKIVNNDYVKTTTNAIKDAYRMWSDGVKVSYVYLTNRGPETGGTRNWKEATNKVSIKKDIRNSIDFTKRFFKGVIEKLEEDDDDSTEGFKKRNEPNAKEQPKERSLPNKKEKETKKETNDTKDIAKEKETKKETNDTKSIAKEKAKIKQEVKRIVKEEFKNNISKQIAKEKVENTKQINKAKAIAKDDLETTKKIAKEEATKKITKDEHEHTKQVAKDKVSDADSKKKEKDSKEKETDSKEKTANSNSKQIVKEKVENTKKIALTKQVTKDEIETTKKVAKEKASEKKDSADTKKIAKDKVEGTKKLAMAKNIVKDKVETTKQVAKTKQITKENHETTKNIAKENAASN